MIYQNFSKRQLLAMTWWNRPELKNYDAIICDGAIRTGKTVCMVDGFFLWATANFDGQSFGICGKTVSSFRRNVVHNLQDWLGGIVEVTEKRSEGCLIVSNGKNTNTFYIFGGVDESSYKVIQGITLAGILLDEVALMPRSFVEQACARCSVPGSKLWFNCNPAGPEHWFYKEWILKRKEKNALRLHFTMADNYALDPAIRERYERSYTGVFYDRYIKGEWAMAEGLIYAFNREEHTVAELPDEVKSSGSWYISVDYGTLNPFSAGLWWVYEGQAIRVAEYYYSGRGESKTLTDEEYYEELNKLAGDRVVQQVIVDPSAASFIATIRRHGRFSVRKAKNNVLFGIRLTATMLKLGIIRIGANCTDAIREFGLYRWDEKGEVDRPIKENDHAMDEIRYFCATVMMRTAGVRQLMKGYGLKDAEED